MVWSGGRAISTEMVSAFLLSWGCIASNRSPRPQSHSELRTQCIYVVQGPGISINIQLHLRHVAEILQKVEVKTKALPSIH